MAQPTPTVVGPVNGYIPAGTTRYVWVPTIASISAPTLAEISAGTDITNAIMGDSSGVAGFSGTSNEVAFPNAGTRWTSQIPGMVTADASSITIGRDLSGAGAALALFSDGTTAGSTQTSGFFVIMLTGNVASGKMKVFPVRVDSLKPSTDPTAASTVQVNFSITQPPSAEIPIPTA